MDNIWINIPDDQLSWAMTRLLAGGGSGAASFNVSPANMKEEDTSKPIE